MWFADSGATSHVTPDASQVSQSSPFAGNDSLIVGNGQSLSIASVGLANIPSANSKLKFPNTLVVPNFRNNLLSISQLTKDNNVVIEFSNSHYLVKDSITREILLQGILKNGLYHSSNKELSSQRSRSAYLTFHQSQHLTWHRKLGHPTLQTLQQILKADLQLPSTQSEFCSICSLGKHHTL
ncbi:hypothetical protein Syun_001829 [Stephania yunnanensis]|uniref:GAG-pre-integrase domain-containing protein n=1 Tax=Stephania yunnanensis TaxID=152371 RepID=A0AAP0Q863_9MAGN